jgi:crotonobetainyl-CoA:carnitine CoA-transferase CaiB-like acyl-CoA transferase
VTTERRLLAPYRVIELGDRRSAFAGTILAELGAEVVLVEPPAGHPTRHAAPFVGGAPGPERSLVHQALNAGKRSVVLDPTVPADRRRFEELLAGADVLVDAGGPAERAASPWYDEAALARIAPGLVRLVVSGFGADGPKADWLDGDLVTGAAGMQLFITGNADKPPLRCAVPQVYAHAGVDGVIGVLAALAQRATTGRGQLVDVSAQQSWVSAAFHYCFFNTWGQPEVARNGSHIRIGTIASRFDFPAADGFITLTFLFGGAVGPFTNRLVAWMAEEGAVDEDLAQVDYTTWDAAGEPGAYDRLSAQVVAFTSSKTKAELLAAARARRLLIAPVLELDEVLAAPQFHERGFWRPTPIAGHDTPVLRPGRLAHAVLDGGRVAVTLADPGPAPALGADSSLPATRTTVPNGTIIPTGTIVPSGTVAPLPLAGVKVLDCTISFAGPTIGRYLADLGATVVKIESQKRPDLARNAGPFLDGVEYDTSACFAHYNAGKLGIALDLTKAGSRPVLDDLVRWADVLVESFAPGALGRLGLDDARLAELNPSLIALSTAMVGQTGPFASLPGYGNMASALCGFVSSTAWPDRPPAGPMGAYTDIISPRFATALLLAALDHRARTGEALRLDFGQGESCLHLLTLGLLDRQVNGGAWEGVGNDDVAEAPHGVYPAAGEDRWVAVAVATDEQWRALCGLLGPTAPADLDGPARLARRRELDALVAAWTAGRPADETARMLQAAGVPAHAVQDSAALRNDPQLEHRGWLVRAPHDRLGELTIGSNPIRLSDGPLTVAKAGPCLGADTFTVLNDILSYDGDRIAELAAGELLE